MVIKKKIVGIISNPAPEVTLHKASVLKIFLLYIGVFFLYSQNPDYFVTESGMEIFCLTDTSSALLNTRLICRAGFSSQTPSTTGFFSLYADLFPKSCSKENQKILELFEMKSSCLSDATVFDATVTPENLKEYLNALEECFCRPVFSDNDIKSIFKDHKEQTESYTQTTTAFINSAIDSRIFQEEPWKTDTGIYPEFFASSTPQDIRLILKKINEQYYLPENSALFISGNISKKELSQILTDVSFTKKTLPLPAVSKKITSENNPLQQKKYILVSDAFSPELTQIIIQYPNVSKGLSDIASAALNSPVSSFMSSITEDTLVSVRSSDYAAVSSAFTKNNCRLIVQALMEDEDKSRNPVEQARRFIDILQNESCLTRKDFVYAQKFLFDKMESIFTRPDEKMKLLSEYWATADISDKSGITSESFFSNFFDFTHSIQNEDEKAINRILKSEPFVFLLVNTNSYKKYSRDFEDAGYSVITEKNSNWYSDKIKSILAMEERKAESQKNVSILSEITGKDIPSPSDSFYYYNNPKISSFKLSNGIPVSMKMSDTNNEVVIILDINKFSDPTTEIICRFFANSTPAFHREIQTFPLHTMIILETTNEELKNTISGLCSAIIYGEISPVKADSFLKESVSESSVKKYLLTEQMKSSIFSQIFKDTEYGNYFSKNKKNPSYDSIQNKYTDFLDASIYSIAIAGNYNSTDLEEFLERSFGLLKEFSPRKEADLLVPKFKSKERKVQLQHLYSSNIPAELAPKEVPYLIPTTEFLDPVQFYFTVPDNHSDKLIFDCIMEELKGRISDTLNMNVSKDLKCSYLNSEDNNHVAILQCENVRHTSQFLSAWKEQRKNLEKDLEKNEQVSQKMKTRWKLRYLKKTSGNRGTSELLMEGMKMNRPAMFLEDYLEVDNTSHIQFVEVLKKFIPNEPAMKVYSADSRK